MHSRRLELIVLPLMAVACSRNPSPGTEPIPVINGVPEQPGVQPSSGRQRWTISPTRETHRYSSTISTSIELNQPAGPVTRDSLISRITFTLETERLAQAIDYTATIEGISSQAGTRTGGMSTSLSLPFRLSGQVDRLRITTDSASLDCSNEVMAVIPVVQRSLVLPPLTLQKDMTWADSVSSAACSGGIPVRATTVRTYKVLGESPLGILIKRQDRTSTAGEGSQGQHRIKLITEGTGDAQLVIDPATGSLVETTGTSSIAVTITASGREQHFVQTVREKTARLQ
ncbi:MAG TPA: hypothetical protein VF042_06535 [Gemmatimonadaceae bacterium]